MFCLLILQANDSSSTSRLVVAIVTLCYNVNDWNMLGEYVILLSKRRGQIKQVGRFTRFF